MSTIRIKGTVNMVEHDVPFELEFDLSVDGIMQEAAWAAGLDEWDDSLTPTNEDVEGYLMGCYGPFGVDVVGYEFVS